jgi:hypothetical protein
MNQRFPASNSEARLPSGKSESDDPTRTRILAALVFFTLTVLVWGLFALDRGTWQDDTSFLAVAKSRVGFLNRCCTPTVSPTRVLSVFPYAIALLTRAPLVTLQLLYGLTWFAAGALIFEIVRLLFPEEHLLAYFAGCLTVCATSDFLTDSLVSLHYQFTVVAYFAAVNCLFRAFRKGRWLWVPPMAIFLSWSLWTSDGAFTSVVLTPLLLWVWNDFRISRRLIALSAAWYAVFAPYAVLFTKFLLDPHSYAAVALVPMTWGDRIARAWSLFSLNFEPWRWSLTRLNWFAPQGRAVPVAFSVAVSAAGAVLFLFAGIRIGRARTAEDRTCAKRWRQRLGFAVLALIMALASNAAFANVQVSEYAYRTQIFSRYWASIFIAIATSLFSEYRLLRHGRFVLPVAFVFLGLYGGLDRQDYYLRFWQRHRLELRSIVRTVPGIASDGNLLLDVPSPHPYLATEADYLARCWTSLLYDDASMSGRTYLWDESRVECQVEGERVACRDMNGSGRFSAPISKLVVLRYRLASNRYEMADSATLAASLGAASVAGYDPSALIRKGPTGLARELLRGPIGLARFLPRNSRPERSLRRMNRP